MSAKSYRWTPATGRRITQRAARLSVEIGSLLDGALQVTPAGGARAEEFIAQVIAIRALWEQCARQMRESDPGLIRHVIRATRELSDALLREEETER